MSEWAGSLITILEAQRQSIDELTLLAERQGDLIRDGRSEALLDLLSQRQSVIDRFISEADRLAGELDQSADRIEMLPAELRGRIRELVRDVDTRLAHVLTLDERDQQSLQQARDESRQQLTSLDNGRTARNAYLQRSGTNRFADHRG